YKGLRQGLDFEQLAAQQQVKINTIEDHILELFIKGYIKDYTDYLETTNYIEFLKYYETHRNQRLREYKALFPHLSYFKIKLVIVGIERGELNVAT
ncbi:hypothetical protein BU068_12925, partial [Staphylococcus succinus]